MILETILKLDPATAAALDALDSFVEPDGTTEDAPDYDAARIHFAECVLSLIAREY